MTAPDTTGDRAERLRRAIAARRAGPPAGKSLLAPRPADAPAIIGDGQRGLWYAHVLEPLSPAYNLCRAFRVAGDLDLGRLETAFRLVVERHRLLRSTFRAHGDTAVQVVHPAGAVDLARMTVPGGLGPEACTREAARPFDLHAGPLVRLRVVDEAPGPQRYLLLVLHHILADERSLARLWQEIASAYEGRLSDTDPPPRVQYDDYAHWVRGADTAHRDADLEFWRARLRPAPDALRLPFERTPRPGDAMGRLLERTCDPAVGSAMRRLATGAQGTPFMAYAFAFRLLLERYAPDRRVAFATPVSTRAYPATADMVGYFLNPLLVCTNPGEQGPVADVLGEFCRDLRDALAHAAAPFDVLAAHLAPHRERDRHPLFQSMFVYQEADAVPTLGGASLEPVTLDLGASKFDLTLFVTEGRHSLRLAVEYRADRFDAEWMEGVLDHYTTLVEQLPAQPERNVADVPWIGRDEQRRLSTWERGPHLELPRPALLSRQILDQCRQRPDAVAVVCDSGSLSYAQLDAQARAIAARLSAEGVRPDDRVGVFVGRSAHMIAAVLGASWAGAAYVPLDPTYPHARTRDIVDDADVAALVTTSALLPRLPSGPWRTVCADTVPCETLDARDLPDVPPTSLAYLLYTSGSTGRPKGVAVTNDNLRASTWARQQAYRRTPSRFLLLPSLAFDSSVAGIFWVLAAGATLVVPSDDEVRDVGRLVGIIVQQQVTGLLCVPSLYAHLLGVGGARLRGLDSVIVAGERCPSRLVGQHFSALPDVRLFNEYGPTEATVWATLHEMRAADAGGAVPIGRPIPGVRLRVLDARGQPVPAGVPGEGWISGPTVACGYWRRDDLTAQRFVELTEGPDPPGRCYRTGDRLSWAADGALLFHGRDDDQIKLRGFRIELGEIEAALLEHPAIERAAVIVRPPGGAPVVPDESASVLLAFVETNEAGPVIGWREQLASRLPEHMLPARVVPLQSLPRLPNGKVDRGALRELPLVPDATPVRAAGLPDPREQALLSLWEGLFGRFDLSVDDNFFELGGHSLLVVQLLAAIERDFGVRLTAPDVFQHPTARELARRIGERGAGALPYDHLFAIQPSGDAAPFVMVVPDFFTQALATRFRGERPVYGVRGVSLRAEGNRGRWPTMTDLAEEVAGEIGRRFPGQRCHLAGYSFGAWLAIETARVLEARGTPARALYAIAPMPLDFWRLGPLRVQVDGLQRPIDEYSTFERLRLYARSCHPLTRGPYRRARQWTTERPWRRLLGVAGALRRRAGLPLTPRLANADVRVERFRLHAAYRPGPLRLTPAVFFNPVGTPSDAAATWRPWFLGPFTVHPTPDPHDDASVDAARQVVMAHLAHLQD